jgi:hypothetical protein
MPVPFNPPSPVLFQLLGWLTDAAKGVVTTSEEKIADVNSQAPVGTTQALIEQGAAVFSSIHARLHESQRRVLRIIARLNRWYLDEQRKNEIVEDIGVTKEDFEKNSDIVPVSDPHIFSETQRYAQIQALAARAQANPDLYNRIAVEKRILKQIKIPDVNEVLPDPQNVKDMNPALENVAMTVGKPVGAFPHQDHLAHIQVLLDYLKNPLYGANPIIAPVYVPAALEHLKQHVTLWYLNQIDQYASAALGRPFDVMREQQLPQMADKLLAAASQHVMLDTEQTFAQLPQVIMAALQTMQQMSSQKQLPPEVKALVDTQMAETQRRATKDQTDAMLDAQRLQLDAAKVEKTEATKLIMNTENNLTAERIKAAELDHDAANLHHEQVKTVLSAQQALQAQMGEPNV